MKMNYETLGSAILYAHDCAAEQVAETKEVYYVLHNKEDDHYWVSTSLSETSKTILKLWWDEGVNAAVVPYD